MQLIFACFTNTLIKNTFPCLCFDHTDAQETLAQQAHTLISSIHQARVRCAQSTAKQYDKRYDEDGRAETNKGTDAQYAVQKVATQDQLKGRSEQRT